MAAVDDLTTARDNYAATLASISASPKPSYSVNGQSFSWTEYQQFLMSTIENLNKQIILLSDPFEIAHQGFT